MEHKQSKKTEASVTTCPSAKSPNTQKSPTKSVPLDPRFDNTIQNKRNVLNPQDTEILDYHFRNFKPCPNDKLFKNKGKGVRQHGT